MNGGYCVHRVPLVRMCDCVYYECTIGVPWVWWCSVGCVPGYRGKGPVCRMISLLMCCPPWLQAPHLPPFSLSCGACGGGSSGDGVGELVSVVVMMVLAIFNIIISTHG